MLTILNKNNDMINQSMNSCLVTILLHSISSKQQICPSWIVSIVKVSSTQILLLFAPSDLCALLFNLRIWSKVVSISYP